MPSCSSTCIGVATWPGKIVATRIASGSTSSRSESAMPLSACLVATYTDICRAGRIETPDPINTTVPLDARSSGSTRRVSAAGAITLVASWRCHSAVSVSANQPGVPTAAECTSASNRGSCDTSSQTDPPSANTAASLRSAESVVLAPQFSSRSVSRPRPMISCVAVSSATIARPMPLLAPVTSATGFDMMLSLGC